MRSCGLKFLESLWEIGTLARLGDNRPLLVDKDNGVYEIGLIQNEDLMSVLQAT